MMMVKKFKMVKLIFSGRFKSALHSLAWHVHIWYFQIFKHRPNSKLSKYLLQIGKRTTMITHKVAQRDRLFNWLKTLEIIARISVNINEKLGPIR